MTTADINTAINNASFTADPSINGQINLVAIDTLNPPGINFMDNIATPIACILASLSNGFSLSAYGNINFYNDVGATSTKTVSITPTQTMFNTPVYFGSVNATAAINAISIQQYYVNAAGFIKNKAYIILVFYKLISKLIIVLESMIQRSR